MRFPFVRRAKLDAALREIATQKDEIARFDIALAAGRGEFGELARKFAEADNARIDLGAEVVRLRETLQRQHAEVTVLRDAIDTRKATAAEHQATIARMDADRARLRKAAEGLVAMLNEG